MNEQKVDDSLCFFTGLSWIRPETAMSQVGLGYITLFVLLNSSKVATPRLGFVLIFESLTQAGVRVLS